MFFLSSCRIYSVYSQDFVVASLLSQGVLLVHQSMSEENVELSELGKRSGKKGSDLDRLKQAEAEDEDSSDAGSYFTKLHKGILKVSQVVGDTADQLVDAGKEHASDFAAKAAEVALDIDVVSNFVILDKAL